MSAFWTTFVPPPCLCEVQDPSHRAVSPDKSAEWIPLPKLLMAIDGLKKGRAADSDGIIAEDIKGCYDETQEVNRSIFNEKNKHDTRLPALGQKVVIKVICKKVTQ